MATVTISGFITLPSGAIGADVFAVNTGFNPSFTFQSVYLGHSTGGPFSFTLDDTKITEPFWLLFDFGGDAHPAIEGQYFYDGSTAGGP